MGFAELYPSYSVFFLYFLTITACTLLFFVDWGKAAKVFESIKKKTWLLLGVFIVAGSILRIAVFPAFYHMQIDEPMFIEQAKHITLDGRIENCRFIDETMKGCWTKVTMSPGWPFLLSFSFRLFGDSPNTAFMAVRLLGILSIVLLFLLGYLLFKDERIGLWCGFLVMAYPYHVEWSSSAMNAVPSAFFVMLVFFLFILFTSTKDKFVGVLSLCVYAFAVLIRYENIIFLPALLLGALVTIVPLRGKMKKFLEKFFPSVLLLITLGAMVLLYFSINMFRVHHSKLLPYLYLSNLPPFIQGISMNYFLLPFFLFGIFWLRNNHVLISFLAAPLMVSSVVFIPLLQQMRMILIPYFFFSLIAAFGLERAIFHAKEKRVVRMCAILAVFALSSFFLLNYYQNATSNEENVLGILEISSLEGIRDAVSSNCTIVSHLPATIHASTQAKGMATTQSFLTPGAAKSMVRNGNCVYFFYEQSCIRNFEGNSILKCRRMMNEFIMQKTNELSYGNKSMALYRITGVVE